jgi:hypothetical protein
MAIRVKALRQPGTELRQLRCSCEEGCHEGCLANDVKARYVETTFLCRQSANDACCFIQNKVGRSHDLQQRRINLSIELFEGRVRDCRRGGARQIHRNGVQRGLKQRNRQHGAQIRDADEGRLHFRRGGTGKAFLLRFRSEEGAQGGQVVAPKGSARS